MSIEDGRAALLRIEAAWKRIQEEARAHDLADYADDLDKNRKITEQIEKMKR